MKKLTLLLMLSGFALLAKAQSADYKPFKFDIQLGYAIPSATTGGDGAKAGVTFTLHPHYRLTDDFAVGLRVEGAGLGTEVNNGDDNSSVKVTVLTSYCASGEYYFTAGGVRPYVGAGLGVFSRSDVVDDNSDGEITSPRLTKFGFFPEAGIEAGHFRLTIDYDVVGSGASYLAFKVGAFFGGGKK